MPDLVNRKTPRAVLWGKLAWHPAAQAWRSFAGDTAEPERIDVLRKGKKSATFRLVGAGPAGEAVIAQRSPAAKAAIERTVYEQVLPRLALTAPHFYGSCDDGDDAVWFFLEDVGDDRIDPSDAAHLSLAGRWVGALHAGAATLPAIRTLPDGGPARYHAHLRVGRDTIRANLGNPALAPEEARALERLLADLDAIDRAWGPIAALCQGMPQTLVHGDIQRKNLHVRHGAAGPQVFLIDWETAGWGVPAADLPRIDLAAYRSQVHATWPDLEPDALRRLAAVGGVLVQLAAIRWVSPEMSYAEALYLARPLSWLRVLHERLSAAVQQLGAVA